MAEFEIQTNQTIGEISFNHEELDAYIEEQIAPYRNLAVTEDSIKDGKEIVARFNRMAKDLNRRRIDAQKVWMGPFDAFKAHIDEAIKKLEEGGSEIKKQLDAFEQMRIEKRKKEIKAIYGREAEGYTEYLSLESLFKKEWLNKGAKDQDIVFSIQESVAKVEADLSAIRALGSEIEDKLISVYKASGNNLSSAITEDARYREARRQVEENLRAEQERRAKEEAERKAREEEARRAKEEAERKANEEAEQRLKEEAEQNSNEDIETQWLEAGFSGIEALPPRPTEEAAGGEIPFISEEGWDIPEESSYTLKVFCDEKALADIRQYLDFNEIRHEVM